MYGQVFLSSIHRHLIHPFIAHGERARSGARYIEGQNSELLALCSLEFGRFLGHWTTTLTFLSNSDEARAKGMNGRPRIASPKDQASQDKISHRRRRRHAVDKFTPLSGLLVSLTCQVQLLGLIRSRTDVSGDRPPMCSQVSRNDSWEAYKLRRVARLIGKARKHAYYCAYTYSGSTYMDHGILCHVSLLWRMWAHGPTDLVV